MPKIRPDVGKEQLSFDLFEFMSRVETRSQEPIPGSFNMDIAIREAVSAALKSTKLDRIGVAAEMSRLLGREITKSMLDCYSAESKERHRFPASFLNAFIEATSDKSLLKMLCEKAGGHFIEGREALSLSAANIQAQIKELRRKERIFRQLMDSLDAERVKKTHG